VVDPPAPAPSLIALSRPSGSDSRAFVGAGGSRDAGADVPASTPALITDRDRGGGVTCSNCGSSEHVATRSYDMDLPTVVLCNICALLIVSDPVMFDELSKT
jgi:hypothetical protein